MRILMTSDAVGGVWTYTMELARALAAHDVEIAVAAMGPPPSDAQRAEFSELANARLFHEPFALEWMESPWCDVDAAGDWLLGLAHEFSADLIHLNGYAHAALDWQRPVLVVAHSCVQTWWRSVRREPAPPRLAEYRRRVRASLCAASAVITPTYAFRRELEDEYELRLPGTAIYNARSSEKFQAEAKEEFIFSAGRVWDPAKNIALLERIAPQVLWPIRVAGDHLPLAAPGAHPIYLGQLGGTLLRRCLARAAIYAAPARYEPFGLSILEAALSGCALVLSDLPSLRELWEGCAVFLPPNDPQGWTMTLNYLAEHAPIRERLQCRALRRGREFTTQLQAAAYLGAYHSLGGGSALESPLVAA